MSTVTTTTPTNHDAAHAPAHKPGALDVHPVPPKLLLAVYGVLLVLTVATVAVTKIQLGMFNVWAALGIAVVKAAVVALFFMHLRWDSPFNAIVFIASMFFVALFIGVVVLDSKEYKVNYDAPGRGQVLSGNDVPYLPPDPNARADGFAGGKAGHYVPQSVVTVGMWLFLAALSMLFIASLVGYVLVRNLNRATYGVSLHFPPLLWASTAMVVGVSFTLTLALASVRREKQAGFRLWVKLALASGIGFVIVQTPAMGQLLMEHLRLRSTVIQSSTGTLHGMPLYGLLFCLILLHALHVVGGLISLGIVTARSLRGAYDHEHFAPVRHCTMYWHFLDAVWLVMFMTFLVVG